MAGEEILKVFTAEQQVELMRGKIISDDTGLSNWNEGSRIRSISEAFALVESSTGMDYVNALRKAIKIMMYEGFGFTRKGAEASSGYLTFYRLPKFKIRYTGAAESCLLTITDSALAINAVGVSGDAVSVSFETYTLISEVIEQINLNTNYTATLVGSDGNSNTLYQYSGKEIAGSLSYNGVAGLDIMATGAGEISSVAGLVVSINDITFQTTAALLIPAGASYATVAAVCMTDGASGNIKVRAIDTYNGKGAFSTPLNGVEYVVNYSAFSGGSDEESEIDRLKRFQYYIKGLAGATVSGMKAAVLAIRGIKSVTIRENHPQRGFNTVITDDGTGQLSSTLINTIILTLDGDPTNYELYPGYRAAGISCNVQGPDVEDVDVTLVIYRIGTLTDEDEIIDAAKTAIEQYINTRRLGQDVVLWELGRVAKSAHSAIYDLAFSTPTVNIPASDSQVLRTGSGTTGSVNISVITLSEEP